MNMHEVMIGWLKETTVEWRLYSFYFRLEGYGWEYGKLELCFEPCLNGFCVGVYDKDLNLLHPKQCNNIDMGKVSIRDAAAMAIALSEIAVEAIKK